MRFSEYEIDQRLAYYSKQLLNQSNPSLTTLKTYLIPKKPIDVIQQKIINELNELKKQELTDRLAQLNKNALKQQHHENVHEVKPQAQRGRLIEAKKMLKQELLDIDALIKNYEIKVRANSLTPNKELHEKIAALKKNQLKTKNKLERVKNQERELASIDREHTQRVLAHQKDKTSDPTKTLSAKNKQMLDDMTVRINKSIEERYERLITQAAERNYFVFTKELKSTLKHRPKQEQASLNELLNSIQQHTQHSSSSKSIKHDLTKINKTIEGHQEQKRKLAGQIANLEIKNAKLKARNTELLQSGLVPDKPITNKTTTETNPSEPTKNKSGFMQKALYPVSLILLFSAAAFISFLGGAMLISLFFMVKAVKKIMDVKECEKNLKTMQGNKEKILKLSKIDIPNQDQAIDNHRVTKARLETQLAQKQKQTSDALKQVNQITMEQPSLYSTVMGTIFTIAEQLPPIESCASIHYDEPTKQESLPSLFNELKEEEFPYIRMSVDFCTQTVNKLCDDLYAFYPATELSTRSTTPVSVEDETYTNQTMARIH